MNRLFFLFTFLIISSITYAQNKLDLNAYLLEHDEAFVKIKIDSEEDIYKLSRHISIEDYDSEHHSVYITDNNLHYFEMFDFEYEILQHPSSLIEVKMFDGTKATYEWDTYPTYESYISMMEQFAADYPNICQVFSIGESEEGRELKFVKISDNVGEKEAEPQFMYTGTMHGDETAGFVILLRLIDYLTENYGTDTEVTELVNNLEIWINPAANPDGTYKSGNHTVNGATRSNANGVNLNRNYKCPIYGDHADGNSWQAETIAFMALAQENNFTMSANTHGGAEVINYPWDIWPRASADDDWWVYVSREYADTAHTFAPSNYMTGFENGITRGYEWYPIFGGRQDFMNYFHHCKEVTIEMSDIKLLAESELDKHWTYNKRSLINYMKQCMYGVHGVITDSITQKIPHQLYETVHVWCSWSYYR